MTFQVGIKIAPNLIDYGLWAENPEDMIPYSPRLRGSNSTEEWRGGVIWVQGWKAFRVWGFMA